VRRNGWPLDFGGSTFKSTPTGSSTSIGCEYPSVKVAILALDFGAVADAMDLELPGEAGRNAINGVGGERTRQTVQRGMFVAGR